MEDLSFHFTGMQPEEQKKEEAPPPLDAEKAAPAPEGEEKKEEAAGNEPPPPPPPPVILGINLHCTGCVNKIKRCVLRCKGNLPFFLSASGARQD
jgi:hypothetical protein